MGYILRECAHQISEFSQNKGGTTQSKVQYTVMHIDATCQDCLVYTMARHERIFSPQSDAPNQQHATTYSTVPILRPHSLNLTWPSRERLKHVPQLFRLYKFNARTMWNIFSYYMDAAQSKHQKLFPIQIFRTSILISVTHQHLSGDSIYVNSRFLIWLNHFYFFPCRITNADYLNGSFHHPIVQQF